MTTPILDIVPSYDVSSGVTLDFNSNYGTNLVRGSQVTIRDQNNNILATHIYIPNTYALASTQHIIPSKQALINESVTPSAYSASTTYNIDAVVSYLNKTYICIQQASGIAPTNDAYWQLLVNGVAPVAYVSDNFETAYVNEKQLQYYVTIFVGYRVVANQVVLSGESGASNTRGAWTLPTPTVTIDNIGESGSIATTSYTLGINYNTNQVATISKVYNPPQQILLNLYRRVGSNWELFQTSGEIYNSGSQLSDTSYYMNYSFEGMVNGDTYYIELQLQTLLGMSVTTQSNQFTINATTYQISSFSVENDSCNGRVIITSDIVDIYGESSSEPIDGELDITNGGYCTWTEGLSFTNNWTMRFWGYDFTVADTIPSDQRVVHLTSAESNGVIDGYFVEVENGYRFDLYVYPIGYDGVTNYYQSNIVSTLGSQTNPLCVLVGFDYDSSGSYYVQIL